ncbi:hypothetical protein F444_18408 [Phytophthora nicotianae P1976]|uniref:Uncharacterized protein n=1 Tax=Phytophthora nicotianae P1976 TaxID=1317066 RepID=A0A080ZBF7_PHYNI|nr:hypothetical protein F444_18408 [Phytophthora nicotianae P1976]
MRDEGFDADALTNGDVPNEIHKLLSATSADPTTPVLDWWKGKGLPEPSSGQMHMLVKIPARYHPHPWCLDVAVYDAMDTAIVRLLYRSSAEYNGYYNPKLRSAGRNILVWYEGTTLNARVLFRRERTALCFKSDLNEEIVTEMSPLEGLTIQTEVTEVAGEPTELHPVGYFDYSSLPIEFPDGVLSSMVDRTSDEFKYQRIEHEDIFGPYGMAYNWCLVTRNNCQQRPSYRKYLLDKSCRLALSYAMSGWYHGYSCDVPVMNIHIESVSEHHVVQDRFEIKLVIRAICIEHGRLILDRLKEGVEVSADGLEMRTSVYVTNPIGFCACMDWRHAQIAERWEAFLGGSSD